MSPRWQEDSGTFELLELFELVEFFELVELFELVEFLAFAWGRHLEAVCWLSRLEVQERLMLLVAFRRKWYYSLRSLLMLA